MNNTVSGTLETHQEVYEWWRSKREEILNGIKEVRASGTVEQEVLDLMGGLLEKARIKVSMDDYFDEED